MAESKNLYRRLLDITKEIGKIEKTGRNTQQSYNFIEQSQVVAELRPLLAEHGVMIVPETISRSVERYEVTRGNGKPGVDVHVQVSSQYTLVNADNPEDRMVCLWDAGEALDTSDKASNKAVTASNKSFLMKLFNISDKDDPDRDHVEASTNRVKLKPAPSHVEDVRAVFPEAEAEFAAKTEEAPSRGVGFISDKQLKFIQGNFNDLGITERADKLAYATKVIGRDVKSATELTLAEAKKVIDKQLADKEDKGGE